MNAAAPTMLVAGLLMLGVAVESQRDVADRQQPVAVVHDVAGVDAEANQTLNDVVDQYCVRCHSERRLTGNLSLEGFDVAAPEESAETAERVIHKLRAGMMPPTGARRPPEDSLTLLVTTLENTLDEIAEESPNPSHPGGLRGLHP